MKLALDILELVLEQHPDVSWIESAAGYRGPDGKEVIPKGAAIHRAELRKLQRQRIGSLDVVLSRQLLRELNRIDPHQFKLPVMVQTRTDFETNLRYLDFTNLHSQRERALISCMEHYDDRGNRVLHYGEHFALTRWPALKAALGERTMIAFRYSEFKIVILVDFRPSGKEFRRRFQHNADAVYALTQQLSSIQELHNLSLLTVKEDILIVDQPSQLLSVYKEHGVRLIIIGDALTKDYRDSLVSIKRYDPYARFMVTTRMNLGDEGRFLFEVEMNYARDNWL